MFAQQNDDFWTQWYQKLNKGSHNGCGIILQPRIIAKKYEMNRFFNTLKVDKIDIYHTKAIEQFYSE